MGAQVHTIIGPASKSIASLAAKGVRFDLAFIDADKSGYKGYYNQVSLGSLLGASQPCAWCAVIAHDSRMPDVYDSKSDDCS